MRNYQHLKAYHIWSNLSMKCLEKIVDCYSQFDASDGIEQPVSLFLGLYSIWPAVICFWKSHEALPMIFFFFFTFLLLNQEHAVCNRFSQSAILNWHTICGPTNQYIYIYLPVGLILSLTNAFRLPPPFWNHMPVCRSSPYLKWCPTLRGLHSLEVRKHCHIISPVISGNRLLGVTMRRQLQ